jgi:hypothetical protein
MFVQIQEVPMRGNRLPRAVALLAGFAFIAGAADVAQQIKTEIQRVRDLASGVTPPQGFKDLKPYIEKTLKAAADDVAAGNVYAGLEKLEQASDMASGIRAAANDAAVVKGGLPAFEVELAKSRQRVSQAGPVAEGAPAAIRALAETARVKAAALLDGGRGFATSMQPKDGLFHLGEAEGLANFARFCAGLDQGRATQGIAVRPLTPELIALQDKTNAAFVPPRSIEKHSTFIGLNSAIKLARDLDEAKLYTGALYQYMDAVLQFGMLNASAPDASAQDALRKSIAAERRKAAASKRDDSIVLAWLGRAESAMGSSPSGDAWKAATVVMTEVLPAYYAALGAARPVQEPAGKAVEVTLVRWPYT